MAMWRVGRKLGRTLYKDGAFVGAVDTPELAAEIVSALNARRERAKEPSVCDSCGKKINDAEDREWHRLADGIERRADTESDIEARTQLLVAADQVRSLASRGTKKNPRCSVCNVVGHYASTCPSRK